MKQILHIALCVLGPLGLALALFVIISAAIFIALFRLLWDVFIALAAHMWGPVSPYVLSFLAFALAWIIAAGVALFAPIILVYFCYEDYLDTRYGRVEDNLEWMYVPRPDRKEADHA